LRRALQTGQQVGEFGALAGVEGSGELGEELSLRARMVRVSAIETLMERCNVGDVGSGAGGGKAGEADDCADDGVVTALERVDAIGQCGSVGANERKQALLFPSEVFE
jgi:hypothetical protein